MGIETVAAPNPAASGNGAIASLFHFVPRPRAVPEPQRYAETKHILAGVGSHC